MVRSAEALQYKRSVAGLYVGPYFGSCPVEVRIKLHPKLTKQGQPSKTRLDLDNCLKVAIDALSHAAYADDAQIVRLAAEVSHPVGGGGLSVSIQEAA